MPDQAIQTPAIVRGGGSLAIADIPFLGNFYDEYAFSRAYHRSGTGCAGNFKSRGTAAGRCNCRSSYGEYWRTSHCSGIKCSYIRYPCCSKSTGTGRGCTIRAVYLQEVQEL